LAICLIPTAPLLAAASPSANAGSSGGARLSLVTILPGKALYSSFGHTAIRVVDGNGDRLYNFGLSANPFDLRFAINMLRGKMDFLVGALRTEPTLAFYRDEENRKIVEQELDLDPDRELALVRSLMTAASAENRVYNYRYFTDNCATKPADMLRDAIGDTAPPFAEQKSKTLRSSVYEVLGTRHWLALALGLVMGPATDRPMPDGPIFLPGDLMRWAARVSYQSEGGTKALVSRTETLYEPKLEQASPLSIPPIAAACILLGLAVAASIQPLRRRSSGLEKAGVAFDWALFGLALVPCLAIFVLWLSAGYGEAAWNLNLLWASPLPLLAMALKGKGRPRPISRWLFRIAACLAALAALFGGFGVQEMQISLRLVAAAIAIRCADRGVLTQA
jgi:hypothetical protein